MTISREAGAGGHALAQAILQTFADQEDSELFSGWQVYDQALCEIVVQDKRFGQSLESLLEEQYHTKTKEFLRQVVHPTIDQDVVMSQVFEVVRAVALMGRTIIVGRAGSRVTRDLPQGISMRVIAPEGLRIERLMSSSNLGYKSALARARDLDTQRARLLKTHFDIDIADPIGYDITWNAGRSSFEEIALALVGLVKARSLRDPMSDLSKQ